MASPPFGRLGHERLDPAPLLVGQVSRTPLGLARNLDHPATALSGPHPKLESQPPMPPQPFSNGLIYHGGDELNCPKALLLYRNN